MTLRYLEAGVGPDMLLVPGWAQTVETWRHQIEDFSRDYHVVAMDHRGHGQSECPDHGYRIARLTCDLHELIVALDLRDLTWVGHSMGCALAWSYWDMFVGERVRCLVLIDEPAPAAFREHWPEGAAAQWGAIMSAADVVELAEQMSAPDGQGVIDGLVGSMANDDVTKTWLVQQGARVARDPVVTLFLDHALHDWRDVLPTISVPALVVGGTASIFPPAAARAVAAAIPCATAEIVDGGSHFAFLEEPVRVNGLIRAFLDRTV